MGTLMAWDIYIFSAITRITLSSSEWQAVAVIAASALIWVLVVWYLAVAIWHKRSGPVGVFALVLGGGMVYLSNILLSFWWWRPRPFVVLDVMPLIKVGVATKSFPSDHAALAFFIAFLLSQYRAKWWWVYLLAAVVAFGRVAVGVHYPFDVVAGALVGLAFGYLTVEVEKLFQPTKT